MPQIRLQIVSRDAAGRLNNENKGYISHLTLLNTGFKQKHCIKVDSYVGKSFFQTSGSQIYTLRHFYPRLQ